jgi:hypothetical protein
MMYLRRLRPSFSLQVNIKTISDVVEIKARVAIALGFKLRIQLRKEEILSAFAKLQKAAIKCVMSLCHVDSPYVRPPAFPH